MGNAGMDTCVSSNLVSLDTEDPEEKAMTTESLISFGSRVSEAPEGEALRTLFGIAVKKDGLEEVQSTLDFVNDEQQAALTGEELTMEPPAAPRSGEASGLSEAMADAEADVHVGAKGEEAHATAIVEPATVEAAASEVLSEQAAVAEAVAGKEADAEQEARHVAVEVIEKALSGEEQHAHQAALAIGGALSLIEAVAADGSRVLSSSEQGVDEVDDAEVMEGATSDELAGRPIASNAVAEQEARNVAVGVIEEALRREDREAALLTDEVPADTEDELRDVATKEPESCIEPAAVEAVQMPQSSFGTAGIPVAEISMEAVATIQSVIAALLAEEEGIVDVHDPAGAETAIHQLPVPPLHRVCITNDVHKVPTAPLSCKSAACPSISLPLRWHTCSAGPNKMCDTHCKPTGLRA